MGQRIVETVGDHLGQELAVALQGQRLVKARDERPAALRRPDGKYRRRPGQSGEVEVFEAGATRARLDLPDSEERVESLEHALNFGRRFLNGFCDPAGPPLPDLAASRRRRTCERGLRRS